jgi:hypothetical protein
MPVASAFFELLEEPQPRVGFLRRQRRRDHYASEIEEDLRNSLGSSIFECLSLESRRHLSRAEREFREGFENEDFRLSVIDFHRAYECEFRHRLIGPVVREFVATIGKKSPAHGSTYLWVVAAFGELHLLFQVGNLMFLAVAVNHVSTRDRIGQAADGDFVLTLQIDGNTRTKRRP